MPLAPDGGYNDAEYAGYDTNADDDEYDDDIDDVDNDYDDFQPIRTMKNCDICSFIIVERNKRLRCACL